MKHKNKNHRRRSKGKHSFRTLFKNYCDEEPTLPFPNTSSLRDCNKLLRHHYTNKDIKIIAKYKCNISGCPNKSDLIINGKFYCNDCNPKPRKPKKVFGSVY